MALNFLNNGYFAGKVGIGTASPERLLSLYSNDSETTPRLLIEQDGAGDAVMAFSLTGGQGWSMGIDNSGGDAFMIHNSSGGVDSSSQFTILNSGNVGIGTISPSQKLEVSTDNYNVSKFVGNTDDGDGYVGAIVEIESNNDSRGRGVYLTHRFATDTSDSEWYAGVPYTGGGYSIGNAAYGTSINSDTGPAHKDQSKLFITEDGNVGIGTTSPGSKLEIAGANSNTNATALFSIQKNEEGYGLFSGLYGSGASWLQSGTADGTTDYSIVMQPNGGNVGIGTTSPLGNLQIGVGGGGTAALFSGFSGVSHGSLKMFAYGNTTPTIQLSANDSGTGGGTTYFNSGNVGIGTSTPTYKLVVGGDVDYSSGIGTTNAIFVQDANYPSVVVGVDNQNYGYIKWDVSGGYLSIATKENYANQDNTLIIKTGNVGIGTTGPQSKLQVAGGIQMADDTATASATKVGTMRYRTGTEYVESTGVQLLLNNNFDTDTVWSKGTGWAISGGTANATASTAYLSQNPFNPSTATYYQITWTISNYSAGTYRFYMRGNVSADFGTSTYVGNGTFTHVMQSGSGGASGFLFDARGALTASVDNIILTEVSVEQASYADMCMQTGASTYEWVNIVRNTY